MQQTRLTSLYETCLNTAIGFVISMLIGHVIFPMYGWHISVSTNLQVTAIYTVASIARGYLVRRWFNAKLHRLAQKLSGEKA